MLKNALNLPQNRKKPLAAGAPPQPPAVFCDFEVSFNGYENIKIASNIKYTDSGMCRIWQRGANWKCPVDGCPQCGPGGKAPAGGLGNEVRQNRQKRTLERLLRERPLGDKMTDCEGLLGERCFWERSLSDKKTLGRKLKDRTLQERPLGDKIFFI